MTRSSITQFLFLAVLIILFGWSSPSYAQSNPTDKIDQISSEKGCRCFRGRPGPECRLYWITEVGFLTTIGSKNGLSGWNESERLAFDIGYMFNVSDRDAVGASFFWHTFTDGDYSYWGLKPRYRRWLSDKVGLDLCFGVGVWEYEFNRKATPLLAQVGVSFKDYFSLTLMYDRARWTESVPIPSSHEVYDGDTFTSSTVSVGMTAGSYTGLAAAGVTIIAAILSIDTLVGD